MLQEYCHRLLGDVKSTKKGFIISIIIGVQFILLCIFAFYCSMLWDEGYTLKTSLFPIADITKIAIGFEGQAPLYYLILGIWRTINDSFFFARLFSILLTSISTFFIFKICKLNLSTRSSYLCVLLFILNPFTWFIGINLRYYALLLLFSLVVYYLFYQIFILGKVSIARLSLFSFVTTLGLLVQYYFPVFSMSLFIIVLIKYRSKIKLYLLSMILPLGMFLFLVFTILPQQIAVYDKLDVENTSSIVFRVINFIRYLFKNTFGLFEVNHIKFLEIIYIAIIIFILLFLVKNVIRSGNIIGKKNLLIISFMYLFFFIIAEVLGYHTIKIWHVVPLYALSLIFIFQQLTLLKNRRLFKIIISCIFTFYILGSINAYKFVRPISYEKVSEYLNDKNKERLPVVVYPNKFALYFDHYIESAKVVQVPQLNYYGKFGHSQWTLNNQSEVKEMFDSLSLNSFYSLIVKDVKFYNVKYETKYLFNYLNLNYIAVKDTTIDKFRIQKFIKKK